MSRNYIDELNDKQRAAVMCTAGPVMIVAGAGSGKTRVLTYRIAYLMQQGIDPFNILALTFTNKAAREMKERIVKIVGGSEAKNLWMGTFHSVFARILRAEHEKIGYPANFTIYDTEDSRGLLKDIIREMQLDEKIYKPSLVHSRISAAKNNLIGPKAYNSNAQAMDDDRMSGKPKLGEIYTIYNKRLFKAGAMDFDDLLYNTNILLRDHTDVLAKYQDRFRYILVDEYQDTNFSQYVIIKQLAARFENICVVGDDAQSIYSFRGANIQNILNFEKDYPELNTFKLEQNYRSTQTIVEAANSVIQNNKSQLEKKVWTQNPQGDKIKVLRALTDNEEGQLVARAIFDLEMNRQARHKDFAILYRTNAQSRSMEEALRKMNIPYRIYGGLSFYQRKEIKDLLAYCRLTINPHDEESLKRIINYPTRGIGDTTIQKLMLAASDHDVSTFTVMENIAEFNLDINAGTKQKISDFVVLINTFRNQVNHLNAYDLGNQVANTTGILRELYNDKTPEGVSRHENIQELLNGMKEFSENINEAVIDLPEGEKELKTLPAFMADIALLTDADEKDDDRNKVSLMTIHAAKGLEFPYVFVTGLEENLFPSQYALTSRADLEEERRLFYVAVTRAEKQLHLSFSETRYRWGNLVTSEPSRFIEELNQEYLEYPEIKQRGPAQAKREKTYRGFGRVNEPEEKVIQRGPAQKTNRKLVKVNVAAPSFDNSHLKDLEAGMTVKHEKFGIGKVLSMEGVYPNNKATVVFDSVGQKNLLIKFARLEIVN